MVSTGRLSDTADIGSGGSAKVNSTQPRRDVSGNRETRERTSSNRGTLASPNSEDRKSTIINVSESESESKYRRSKSEGGRRG
jgi:hypothetical protein